MKETFISKIPQIPSINLIGNSANPSTSSKFSIKSSLPVNSKLILLPASIREIKDVIFAINAMSTVLLSNPSHYFFIIGSIREEFYHKKVLVFLKEKLIEFPQLIDKIKILDYILYDDFLAIIKESDLVLNTSIAEGMSGSIIEAMALEVPVLVREISGNLVLVEDGKTGLVFNDLGDFKEKYTRIFEEEILRKNIVKMANQRFFKEFGFEKEAKEYRGIVEEIFEKNYREIDIEGDLWRILDKETVHSIMKENNEVFKEIKGFDGVLLKKKGVKILDLACGNGIFGFFAMGILRKKGAFIEEIVFSDVEIKALRSAYSNVVLNQGYFKGIGKVEFIKSNLFDDLKGKFNVILANFPQTPSSKQFRGFSLIFLQFFSVICNKKRIDGEKKMGPFTMLSLLEKSANLHTKILLFLCCKTLKNPILSINSLEIDI